MKVTAMDGKTLPITPKDLETIRKQVTAVELTCKSETPHQIDTLYDTLVGEIFNYRVNACKGHFNI
jgi:hypothetical protein